MAERISLSISGPAFSFLLYETARSSYEQEGFLLGECIEKETKTITDNDLPTVTVERIIKVNSALPCPKLCYFYNGTGEIDKERLKSYLGDQALKVVAWYKSRYTPNYNLTLREKIVHKQLAKIFPVSPELFCCCLLATDNINASSTHTFKQSFIRFYDPIFQHVPMHIVNLSDPNTNYKTLQASSETFNKIVQSIKIDTKKNQGSAVVERIQTAVQSQIYKVVAVLSEKEKQLFDLEQEIKQIENRLQWQNANQKSDIPAVPNGDAANDDMMKFSPASSTDNSPKVARKNIRGRGVAIKDSNRNLVNNMPLTRSKTKPQTPTETATQLSYSQVAQKAKN